MIASFVFNDSRSRTRNGESLRSSHVKDGQKTFCWPLKVMVFLWKKYAIPIKRTNYAVMAAHDRLIMACMRMRPNLSLVEIR